MTQGSTGDWNSRLSQTMYLIELSYKNPLDEVDEHLKAHRAFLDKYYEADLFIMSGPKEPRTGGVILAQDEADIDGMIQEDPFYIYGIAEYGVTRFLPNRCSELIELFCGAEANS